jgi:hypothetical protein
MSDKKHRKNFAKKLARAFFRSEDWQHTPHIYETRPVVQPSTTAAQATSTLSDVSAFCPRFMLTNLRLMVAPVHSIDENITRESDGQSKRSVSNSDNHTSPGEVKTLSVYWDTDRFGDLPSGSPTSLLPTHRVNPLGWEDISGDRKRTEERYSSAISLLKETLRLQTASWDTVEFPDFDDLLEGQDMSNLVMQSRRN